VNAPSAVLRCAGCGTHPEADDPYPFRCPRDGSDNTDHVMTVVVDGAAGPFPAGDDPSPFVRYRRLAYSHAVARAHGLADADYVALVRTLDGAVGPSMDVDLPPRRSARTRGLVSGWAPWETAGSGSRMRPATCRDLTRVAISWGC